MTELLLHDSCITIIDDRAYQRKKSNQEPWLVWLSRGRTAQWKVA